MRRGQLITIVLIAAFCCGALPLSAQTELRRRNPDGWFTLLVPKSFGHVEKHADVAGGFYPAHDPNVSWDYWTYEGTPNFLRDVGNRFSKRPILACTSAELHIRTTHLIVDNKKAILQECTVGKRKAAAQYLVYLTFPKIGVLDSGSSEDGMFSITVKYKKTSDRMTARRIVLSLKFRNS
jgi:hypothetical protein